MTQEMLFQIWDRFEKSDVSELVFETPEGKIELKRNNTVTNNIVPAVQPDSVAKDENPAATAKETVEQNIGGANDFVLKAPLVGTFYRASGPGEEPFVQIGQRVRKGDIIGIIEAMKLMNEITAPCDGMVKSIFVEDGTLVEFDQMILSIGE